VQGKRAPRRQPRQRQNPRLLRVIADSPGSSNAFPQNTIMEDNAVARFSSIPWAAALINDDRWTPTPTISRILKPSGEDIFFAETLNTDRTIRKCLTLKPAAEEDGELAYKELMTILEFGEGLNGYPGILHGGFVATILDEVCGLLIVINVDERVYRMGSQHSKSYFTACM
jgi:thioesterase superfamily protein 4